MRRSIAVFLDPNPAITARRLAASEASRLRRRPSRSVARTTTTEEPRRRWSGNPRRRTTRRRPSNDDGSHRRPSNDDGSPSFVTRTLAPLRVARPVASTTARSNHPNSASLRRSTIALPDPPVVRDFFAVAGSPPACTPRVYGPRFRTSSTAMTTTLDTTARHMGAKMNDPRARRSRWEASDHRACSAAKRSLSTMSRMRSSCFAPSAAPAAAAFFSRTTVQSISSPRTTRRPRAAAPRLWSRRTRPTSPRRLRAPGRASVARRGTRW